MPTITMANLSPAKWRVLNALFFRAIGGGTPHSVSVIMGEQDVSLPALVDLEKSVHVVAHMGEMPIDLADLSPGASFAAWSKVSVRLTTLGRRRVISSVPNNVICMLAQAPRYTATARTLRTEGEADDETLKGMEEQGLIEGLMPLGSFQHIPPTMQIKVTRKGRQYFPR